MRYLKILKKRNFFLLWFGQIISQFGDRLTQIALVGLVSAASKSSAQLAVVMSMAIVPVFIISPISGVYIDRWDKRKTLYLCDSIRVILMLLIPFVFLKSHSLIPIYALIFLSFSAGRFFIPAKMAFLPRVVEKKDIFMANSLISNTATIAAVLGIGLGGVLVERYGLVVGFNLDAATFFISGMSIFLISVQGKGEFLAKDILDIGKNVVASVKKSFLYELKEGIGYIFKSKETKYAFKIFFFLFSYIGALYVVFIRFIQNTLSSVTKDVGFAAVGLGAGIFLGTLAYGRIAHKFSIKKVINWSVLLSSFFIVFFAVFLRGYPYTICLILLAFGLGIMISPAFVGVNALIHRESDENLLGRIFSGLEFTSHLGFLVAMLCASILADIMTPFTIVVSVGIIGSFFSLCFIFCDDYSS
ncbi:MAG: MFS transporter [Candidatus Omnitrophica bacterium]|nr:MFS transporter [Candidatus Omnitrophota bacterium]